MNKSFNSNPLLVLFKVTL